MKKLLIIIGISLVSINSYALEHVVGVSAGYNFQNAELKHHITNRYLNPNPDDENSPTYITKGFNNKSSAFNQGTNFDIEYQLRARFLTIGVGYSNSKTELNFNYYDIEKFNYTNNIPYLIIMFSAIDSKYVAIKLGATIGVNLVKTDFDNLDSSNNGYNNYYNSFLIDSEFKVYKNLMLFTRASYVVTRTDIYYKNSNIIFGGANDTSIYPGAEITSNHIIFDPQTQLFKINFGIRYKI
ncbi:MAG: hypothetical protein LBH40_05855 [Alphaproteobacteria bacterium]|jgi:hypothetical protein|nr:hypothetical protein [Alphaproteobacteria bacterium]